jgi:hypothetical protein
MIKRCVFFMSQGVEHRQTARWSSFIPPFLDAIRRSTARTYTFSLSHQRTVCLIGQTSRDLLFLENQQLQEEALWAATTKACWTCSAGSRSLGRQYTSSRTSARTVGLGLEIFGKNSIFWIASYSDFLVSKKKTITFAIV